MRSVFAFLLFISTSAFSQTSDYSKLKLKLKKNLALLENYNFWRSQDLDIDSVADLTGKQLVRLLKCAESKNLDPKEFPNLTLAVQTNDSLRIRVFEFGFDCGGTRGRIDYPVIQWTNREGQLFAYNLFSTVSSAFLSIQHLPDDHDALYLLSGMEKGNTSHIYSHALVLRFKGDYLYTDYPAFANRSLLKFSNTTIAYDTDSGVLTLSSDDGTDLQSLIEEEMGYSDARDSAACHSFYRFLLEGYSQENNDVTLFFNGNQFLPNPPYTPIFRRLPNEPLQQFLEVSAPDSTTLTSQFFESNAWDSTKKIIFCFYDKTLRNGADQIVIGYLFIPIYGGYYRRELIDTIESQGGLPKIEAVFFANADSAKDKELAVLISWEQLLHYDFSGTLYATQFYEKPDLEKLPERLIYLEETSNAFSECDCEWRDGTSKTAQFKTAAAVKAELKRRGY